MAMTPASPAMREPYVLVLSAGVGGARPVVILPIMFHAQNLWITM